MESAGDLLSLDSSWQSLLDICLEEGNNIKNRIIKQTNKKKLLVKNNYLHTQKSI